MQVSNNYAQDLKTARAIGLVSGKAPKKDELYAIIRHNNDMLLALVTQPTAIAKPVLLKDKPARPVVAMPVKRAAIVVTPGMAWARKPAKPIKRSKA